MNCISCGKELPDTMQRCPYCGANPKPKKKVGMVRKVIGWLLIILSTMSIAGNIMTCINYPYGFFGALMELSPALLFAAVLILVGAKLADPENDSFLIAFFKVPAVLVVVFGGLGVLISLLSLLL